MSVQSNPAYIFSLAESVGSLTAKNHLVVHNPAGSGKTMFLSAFFGSHVTLSPPVLTAPLRGPARRLISFPRRPACRWL